MTIPATTTPPVGCPLQGAIVSPAQANIPIADTLRFHARLNSCVDPNGTATFTWLSSDTLVASVDTSGLVRGLSKGTATIIATVVQSPLVQGAAAVTVVSK